MEQRHNLGMLLGRARKLLRREFEARLAVVDLTVPQIYVLKSLWEADGLPISHLSNLACSDGPTLTSLLDRMEAKGLIARERDPHDRRVVRIYLCPHGHELKETVIAAGDEIYALVRQGLTQDQHTELCSLLELLCETLDGTPLPAPEVVAAPPMPVGAAAARSVEARREA